MVGSEDEVPSVRQRAKELLKDSSKFLITEIKSALSRDRGTHHLLEQWRDGSRDLHRRPVSLDSLVLGSVDNCEQICEQLMLQLTFEQHVDLPELELDGPRIEAVLETLLTTSLHFLGRNTVVHIRSGEDEALVAVGPTRPDPRGMDRLQGLLDSTDSELALARDIVVAHGGELKIHVSEAETALNLTLPLE